MSTTLCRGSVESIRKKHAGKDIAVVASGPSSVSFSGREDVSIAVNGAAELFPATDYFVCMDGRSPRRAWFNTPSGARILSSYVIPFSAAAYPDARARHHVQEELAAWLNKPFMGEEELLDVLIETYDPRLWSFTPSLEPACPHVYFNVGEDFSLVSRDQELIIHGASVSGAALQIAFLMGARNIHLYGCSFDNDGGARYCYHPKESEHGKTEPYHVPNMDRLIGIVGRLGVDVYVHGPSRLTRGINLQR